MRRSRTSTKRPKSVLARPDSIHPADSHALSTAKLDSSYPPHALARADTWPDSFHPATHADVWLDVIYPGKLPNDHRHALRTPNSSKKPSALEPGVLETNSGNTELISFNLMEAKLLPHYKFSDL